MDIFTTQLTRVVQVPIKAASLKVKALLKDAGTGKLKEDPDHLENHQYYFVDEDNHKNNKQSKEESNKKEQAKNNSKETKDDELEEGSLYLVQDALNKDDEGKKKQKPKLDLYV